MHSAFPEDKNGNYGTEKPQHRVFSKYIMGYSVLKFPFFWWVASNKESYQLAVRTPPAALLLTSCADEPCRPLSLPCRDSDVVISCEVAVTVATVDKTWHQSDGKKYTLNMLLLLFMLSVANPGFPSWGWGYGERTGTLRDTPRSVTGLT